MATVIAEGTLAELRRSFRGQVVQPDDPDYEDTRRIWNAAITRRPALIARCSEVADVVAAVRFAAEHELLTAVRGGGHNVSGSALSDGGMVVDLSLLRVVAVDPQTRTARVQPGARLGDLDRACQPFGLAVPAGINTTTGVAGLTLGGGIGWLMRRNGLTCDSLVGAEVVTAEGSVVRASETENADLFWGLRGGGGNFGIVTAFDFRLCEVGPQVSGGVIFYPAEQAADVLRGYADFAAAAPEQVTTIVALRRIPPFSPFPESLWRRPVVGIAACHAGGPADGQRTLERLRHLGAPLLDRLGVTPFLVQQSLFDATVPAGWRYYWRSEYLRPLDGDAIDVLVDNAWSCTAPMSYTLVAHMGGAVRSLSDEAAAFTGRGAEHAININMVQRDLSEPDDTDWARRFHAAVKPHSAGGVYVNFLGNEGAQRVQQAYGEGKWARLVELKRRWDTSNLFRVNQNIPPD